MMMPITAHVKDERHQEVTSSRMPINSCSTGERDMSSTASATLPMTGVSWHTTSLATLSTPPEALYDPLILSIEIAESCSVSLKANEHPHVVV